MPALNELEIRRWLTRYLSGEISLREFEDWFVPVSWDVEKTENNFAIELAHTIELRLAEFSSGHRSEDDLQSSLRPLVQTLEHPVTE